MILTIGLQFCRFTDNEHLKKFAANIIQNHSEIHTVRFKYGSKYKEFLRNEFI